MHITERFKNKFAIVTGAADGIGKGVALRLGQEGATVALFDINEPLLKKTISEFHGAGIVAKGYKVDISNEDEISRAISEVEKEFGNIDVLIHAAGIVGPTNAKITEYNSTDFDNMYKVSLTSLS